ncbi:alkaline phosphatase D family protein [Zhongshania borealis]|uniref:Alkaline phosphatase D family protein n=1 Tax=Zhongshania borealis TaxID=889488 RepID=A0ABP7WZ90_9GAMM
MGKRKSRRGLSRRSFLRRIGLGGAAVGVAAGSTATVSIAASSSEQKAISQAQSPFQHGVASGDPLQNALIIWTRLSIEGSLPCDVSWEVAESPLFSSIVAQGVFTTDSSRDHTVKIDVTGLSPETSYYYRFSALDFVSQIGRGRTLPQGTVDHLRLAVVSCASIPHGFFNAYRRVAERPDLDCVIHLGDYIYEYGNDGYGSDVQAGGRIYEPGHEMVSLSDYRRRHAQYKRDLDLQRCHQQHPFICVWDDHEFTNDAWLGGAENHNDGEGDWAQRSSFALQAYSEWMPIRLPEPGNSARIYRQFRFGDLLDLIMLDTRFVGRDQQLAGSIPNEVPGLGGFGFIDAGDIASTERGLLGEPQKQFLGNALTSSPTQWRFLGQQVMFGQLKLIGEPNALNILNPGGQGGIFLNTDQWDGYPRAREEIWAMIRGSSGAPVDNVVVLTGDIHTAWSMDINEDPNNPIAYNPLDGSGSMAVEFVATSVSSPGLDEVRELGEEGLKIVNPHMKYINLREHGYLLLDLTPERCQGEHWFVDSIEGPSRGESLAAAHFTASGENRLQSAAGASTAKANPPAPAPYEGIPL